MRGFYINGRMREMKSEAPNPAGREGRPISLYPLKPKDAIRGLLAVKPPPKDTHKQAKKTKKRK
jgi:hypothetical protein